jgi:hypothetical protein
VHVACLVVVDFPSSEVTTVSLHAVLYAVVFGMVQAPYSSGVQADRQTADIIATPKARSIFFPDIPETPKVINATL